MQALEPPVLPVAHGVQSSLREGSDVSDAYQGIPVKGGEVHSTPTSEPGVHVHSPEAL